MAWIRDHFRPIDEPYFYRLRIDGFLATVTDYGPTTLAGWSGPALGEPFDRALWLRSDGRVTAYDDAGGASSLDRERVTVPNADASPRGRAHQTRTRLPQPGIPGPA